MTSGVLFLDFEQECVRRDFKSSEDDDYSTASAATGWCAQRVVHQNPRAELSAPSGRCAQRVVHQNPRVELSAPSGRCARGTVARHESISFVLRHATANLLSLAKGFV